MPPYRVQFVGLSEAQFLSVLRAETYAGRGRAVLRAMRQVVRSLEQAPLTQGDPMYRIRSMRLQVRHITISPLYVEYGVHDTAPLVLIRFVATFRGQVIL